LTSASAVASTRSRSTSGDFAMMSASVIFCYAMFCDPCRSPSRR
jgi:hypothetical protein